MERGPRLRGRGRLFHQQRFQRADQPEPISWSSDVSRKPFCSSAGLNNDLAIFRTAYALLFHMHNTTADVLRFIFLFNSGGGGKKKSHASCLWDRKSAASLFSFCDKSAGVIRYLCARRGWAGANRRLPAALHVLGTFGRHQSSLTSVLMQRTFTLRFMAAADGSTVCG